MTTTLATRVAALCEAGRLAGPGPFAETVLGHLGVVLPEGPSAVALADGLTLAYAHPAVTRVGPVGTSGEDAALRVSGTLPRVPYGATSTVLVLTEGPGGPVLFPVDPARTTAVPGINLAGEPRDTLHLNDYAVAADDVHPLTPAELAEAGLRAALARAALIAGAAERCVELTVQHTTTRAQFGRPLSHFQAVKQEEARLIEESALVRAAVDAAARELSLVGVAAAKAQASASVAEIARIAHQLHGAIGFTELSELRFATTRLWSWRDEDGDESYWTALLGRAALAADDVWALLAV
ncbi:acyl-CoA dehydrogenase family protein [Streptomyces murinus]|uniref:acyl-CoA dehydrogenase family protein n=1 Tax=Streptomyces murinus TaxID=33900 RepID=UPI002E1596F2|nr:acyl-CoA dehydrogenase family protein [Streptomyces murinus]WSI83074.1 acyl-CoA dehydrogenase family protein [Streptomyces murinus]